MEESIPKNDLVVNWISLVSYGCNAVMLKVRSELCLGCGLCAEVCHRKVISFPRGYAQINESRCDNCHNCLEVCPQGAIVEMVPVSGDELRAMVSSLRQRAGGLVERLELLIASQKEGR